jgi:hypothetical protein
MSTLLSGCAYITATILRCTACALIHHATTRTLSCATAAAAADVPHHTAATQPHRTMRTACMHTHTALHCSYACCVLLHLYQNQPFFFGAASAAAAAGVCAFAVLAAADALPAVGLLLVLAALALAFSDDFTAFAGAAALSGAAAAFFFLPPNHLPITSALSST